MGAAAEGEGCVAGMMAGDDGNEWMWGSRCSSSLPTAMILSPESRRGLGLRLFVASDLLFGRGDGVDDHSVSGELNGETGSRRSTDEALATGEAAYILGPGVEYKNVPLRS